MKQIKIFNWCQISRSNYLTLISKNNTNLKAETYSVTFTATGNLSDLRDHGSCLGPLRGRRGQGSKDSCKCVIKDACSYMCLAQLGGMSEKGEYFHVAFWGTFALISIIVWKWSYCNLETETCSYCIYGCCERNQNINQKYCRVNLRLHIIQYLIVAYECFKLLASLNLILIFLFLEDIENDQKP